MDKYIILTRCNFSAASRSRLLEIVISGDLYSRLLQQTKPNYYFKYSSFVCCPASNKYQAHCRVHSDAHAAQGVCCCCCFIASHNRNVVYFACLHPFLPPHVLVF